MYHSFALKNVNYIFFRNGDTGGRISRYSLLSILSQLQNIDCTVNNKVGYMYIKTRLVQSSTVSHCVSLWNLSHSNSTLKPFNRLMKIILYIRDLLPIENINFTDQGFMIYMHTLHWLDIGNICELHYTCTRVLRNFLPIRNENLGMRILELQYHASYLSPHYKVHALSNKVF